MNKTLTDSELYSKCKQYGSNARLWMRKFESLLPEVYSRRLYKRRGCSSIHEFAAKLAGMSPKKVDKILRLSKRLEDKPKLKELFEEAEVEYTKIETVSYQATPETDEEWAEKAATMSRLELETEIKTTKSLPGETFENKFNKLTINLDPNTEKLLRQLKQQLEKTKGETLSFGEVLKELLKNNPQPATKKPKTIQLCPDCITRRANEKAQQSEVTRYVPVEIRNLVLLKQNFTCAKSNCLHPPSELHHIDGYALTKNHDPTRLEYLCQKHHYLEHAQDKYVQKFRA